jgi:hypothetical protein
MIPPIGVPGTAIAAEAKTLVVIKVTAASLSATKFINLRAIRMKLSFLQR